jgi:peptide/nickel transport system permease protein
MIPRILPVLIPTFVTLIPTFVFLEASLALLGSAIPVLPTWGKVLNDAQAKARSITATITGWWRRPSC